MAGPTGFRLLSAKQAAEVILTCGGCSGAESIPLLMRRLFIPGYYCGFSNNKMSLDVAVVLAYLTGRVLVPYRFRLPRQFPVNLKNGDWPEPLSIPDLYEMPIAWSNEYLLKTWICVPRAIDCVWESVFDSVLCFPATLEGDGSRLKDFQNGRPHLYAFYEWEDEAPDLHIHTHSLGHYSHFFYLDDERRRAVIDLMKRLRPKRPYLEAADRIAASLGTFNAIHIRRGDFVSNELARRKISRAASITGQEVVANLASRMSRGEPLVVCTDGSHQDEFFVPIRRHFREVIFLDQYIRENSVIRKMIAELPRDDEAVEALLTQLVASKAQAFAGTLFSTFTALIHRLRGFANPDSHFLYCYNDFMSGPVRYENCEFLPVADGPFSWNRIRYPVSPGAYSWLREWPEAFDIAPPPS